MAKNISLENLERYDQWIKDYILSHGGGSGNIVELTQEEYDALPEVDPKTMYLIWDGISEAFTCSSIIYDNTRTLRDKLDEIDTDMDAVWEDLQIFSNEIEKLQQTPIEPKEGVVLNTIDDKLNYLIENGGGSGGEELSDPLWINANPGTGFPEQNINIDLKDYKAVVIEIIDHIGTQQIVGKGYIAKNKNERITGIWTGGTNTFCCRNFAVSDTGVYAYGGVYVSTSSNNSAIPTKIWGIKTLLA